MILNEMLGGLYMDIEHAVYVSELQTMLACDQSDGYLKKWAKDRLESVEHQAQSVADLKKVPALIS